MGYSDEKTTTDPGPLPVGCIFDGAMGWHNTYRIVDLAIALGMDKEPDLGWSENDAKIMAAYEAGLTELVLNDAEALDEPGIGDVAQHWCEKAFDYLSENFMPPLCYLEWDDGLYVREYSAEEVFDVQGWNDSTRLDVAMQYIRNQDQDQAWDDFVRDFAHTYNTGP
jgi:hypothetical protein